MISSFDGLRLLPYSHVSITSQEFIVSKKMFAVLGSALLASAAFAQNQPSLGTVRNVEGLVTDTDGASVTSTETGEAIHDGERFVTSSSGTVTLQLNNGCTLTLQPNQAVTIDRNMTCRQLVAAVEQVGGGTALGFAAAGSPRAGALAVGGLILAGYGIHRVTFGRDKDPEKGKDDQDLSGR